MIRAFQVSDGRGAAPQDEAIWHRFERTARVILPECAG
jgi:hypothetical protein